MKTKYELIVVGGGFAGMGAAIAAARQGTDVLIVEKNGYLSGSAAMSYVNPFMGEYRIRSSEDGERDIVVNAGIFEEVRQQLMNYGAYRKAGSAFNMEILKIIFDRMCKDAGVSVLFHAYVTDVVKADDRISAINVACRGNKYTFEADCFIDATGDANLSYMAGCNCRLGRDADNLCQPMTLCFRMGEIDTESYWKNLKDVQKIWKEKLSNGELLNPRENILSFHLVEEGVVHLNTTRVVKKNPVDIIGLSEAEALAREQMLEFINFVRENIPGCENAQVISAAPEIGVRESRMIEGEYTVSVEDFFECVQFEDSVARGAYPVDIHSPDGTGTLIQKIPVGKYYTIPYRSLIPKDMKNLLVAGRCISTTHEAQSAYRIMPICCCIGEGAGVAASLAVKNSLSDVRDVNIDEVHAILDSVGALY
ncbi:MAG: FAD-dependent oxidoreductase [Clostridia bacterium]|nr:FAD-dependent oxidoreductase [Clostridia bacterium]